MPSIIFSSKRMLMPVRMTPSISAKRSMTELIVGRDTEEECLLFCSSLCVESSVGCKEETRAGVVTEVGHHKFKFAPGEPKSSF